MCGEESKEESTDIDHFISHNTSMAYYSLASQKTISEGDT